MNAYLQRCILIHLNCIFWRAEVLTCTQTQGVLRVRCSSSPLTEHSIKHTSFLEHTLHLIHYTYIFHGIPYILHLMH